MEWCASREQLKTKSVRLRQKSPTGARFEVFGTGAAGTVATKGPERCSARLAIEVHIPFEIWAGAEKNGIPAFPWIRGNLPPLR
jgi:hypothetical protein